MRSLVIVVIVVVVSVTGLYFWGGVVSRTPNPQPGGTQVLGFIWSLLWDLPGLVKPPRASRVLETPKTPHHLLCPSTGGSGCAYSGTYSVWFYYVDPNIHLQSTPEAKIPYTRYAACACVHGMRLACFHINEDPFVFSLCLIDNFWSNNIANQSKLEVDLLQTEPRNQLVAIVMTYKWYRAC